MVRVYRLPRRSLFQEDDIESIIIDREENLNGEFGIQARETAYNFQVSFAND